jgi:hypothetical protein
MGSDTIKAIKNMNETTLISIHDMDKKREEFLQDYDSYRRRLKDFEKKRDDSLLKLKNEVNLKNVEKNAIALNQAQDAVNKFEIKLQKSSTDFDVMNENAKLQIIESKRHCEIILDELFNIIIKNQVRVHYNLFSIDILLTDYSLYLLLKERTVL